MADQDIMILAISIEQACAETLYGDGRERTVSELCFFCFLVTRRAGCDETTCVFRELIELKIHRFFFWLCTASDQIRPKKNNNKYIRFPKKKREKTMPQPIEQPTVKIHWRWIKMAPNSNIHISVPNSTETNA